MKLLTRYLQTIISIKASKCVNYLDVFAYVKVKRRKT